MKASIRDSLAGRFDEELLFLDPAELYDSCIAGIAERCGMDPVVCYDATKVLAALQSDGMSEEEAQEWFDFNMAGAYVGQRTPLFLVRIEEIF